MRQVVQGVAHSRYMFWAVGSITDSTAGVGRNREVVGSRTGVIISGSGETGRRARRTGCRGAGGGGEEVKGVVRGRRGGRGRRQGRLL